MTTNYKEFEQIRNDCDHASRRLFNISCRLESLIKEIISIKDQIDYHQYDLLQIKNNVRLDSEKIKNKE